MEDITTEKLIMEQTFYNLLLFQLLVYVAQSLAVATLTMNTFRSKYHTVLSLGINIVFIYSIFHYTPYSSFPFIPFEFLYAARDDANTCLDLLRLETLKSPTRTSYSATYGSCTAFLGLWLSDMDVGNHAAFAEKIGFLERFVAAQFFMGTAFRSSRGENSVGDFVETSFASLHCTKSWSGIARWIAKWQLRNSFANSTQDIAPSEATPPWKK